MANRALASQFGVILDCIAAIVSRVSRRLTPRKRQTSQLIKSKLKFLNKRRETPNQLEIAPLATKLNDKLWCGFSRYALRDLDKLKRATSAALEERRAAAWYLARWYAFQKDYTRALTCAAFLDDVNPHGHSGKKQSLLKVECLLRLGRNDEAQRILDRQLETTGHDPDLCLAYANTYVFADGSPTSRDHEATRLEWINRIYIKLGLVPLVKADEQRPLAIDNLTTPHPPKIDKGPKVSVIVPAYNAQRSLPSALRGLLAQSWQNLEVIIVDDRSLDETFAVAEHFAQNDSRITLLRQSQNLGAYSARNKALEIATGELITTHDADDWSHPQKIEVQTNNLLRNTKFLGNYSHWVRTEHSLRFAIPAWRNRQLMINKSMVSTLFRRNVFVNYGPWDSVRVGADSEYINRIRKSSGHNCIYAVLPSIPLSFGLDDDSSLTRNRVTHSQTSRFGIRREYHESAEHWLASGSCELGVKRQSRTCPFPVPGIILSERENDVKSDVVFVMDFNINGNAFQSSLAVIQATIARGLSVTLFQWPLYESDVKKPLKSEIRQMAQEGKLRIVAPGEKVSTSTVVVCYSPLLKHVIDPCPDVTFSSLLVLVNHMAARQCDHRVARKNLQGLFGTEGTWVLESELHTRLMKLPTTAA